MAMPSRPTFSKSDILLGKSSLAMRGYFVEQDPADWKEVTLIRASFSSL